MSSKIFSPGVKVTFIDPSEASRWFAREVTGIVVESRQYGLTDSMVTAQFGSVRIHVSSRSLKIVADS